jgi:hypothetical protein
MQLLEFIIIFVVIVAGVLAQIQLFYHSRSWLFSLQVSPPVSIVRYRSIRGGYFTLLWLGLIALIVAGVYGNRQPTETLWLGIAFVSFTSLLSSSFVLVNLRPAPAERRPTACAGATGSSLRRKHQRL